MDNQTARDHLTPFLCTLVNKCVENFDVGSTNVACWEAAQPVTTTVSATSNQLGDKMTDAGVSFPDVWLTIVDELVDDTRVNPPLTRQQKAWLSLVRPLTLTEGFALLSVPNRVVQEQIERNLRNIICGALSRHLGQSVDLGVRIQPLTELEPDPKETDHRDGDGDNESPDDTWVEQRRTFVERRGDDWSDVFRRSPGSESAAPSSGSLHPRYTFDTFVIGASNRFAHASAVAVAESPARAYNPLFIWGESGLGKTHLLHAAGHYALRLFPNLRVKYVSTEEFTNDFINSLRDDRRVQFQRRYRDEVDILLVDDIQFLIGREGTQEEFFHLQHPAQRRQADHHLLRPSAPSAGNPGRPSAHTLRGRSHHRCPAARPRDPCRHPSQEGPDGQDRCPRRRAGTHRVPHRAQTSASSGRPDPRDRVRLAHQRRVEPLAGRGGAPQPVTRSRCPEVSAAKILAVTADYFSVTIDTLRGPSRKSEIVMPRQIAMYLCRELTDLVAEDR